MNLSKLLVKNGAEVTFAARRADPDVLTLPIWVYKSQQSVIEQALDTAALMLGSDKSRGYCLEMICADFLAGAHLQRASVWCDRVVLADLEQGLPSSCGHYDVVLLSHVLEHLANPTRLLADAGQALISGGVIVVVLPNVLHWRQRLQFLFGRFEYTDAGILDDTHLRFYTPATARELLLRHKYQIITEIVDGSFPMPKVRRFVPLRVATRIDRLACRLGPGLFGYT